MFVSVFVLFFSIGHVLGWTLDGIFSEPGYRMQNSSKQLNILIITIDHFDVVDPKLDGIWLALYIPNNFTVSFIPIIPSSSSNSLIFEQEVIKNFYLKTNKTLGSAFVKILNENKIYWDNFVIIDSIGLSELVTNITKYNFASSMAKINLLLPRYASLNKNYLDAANIQAELIQQICINQPLSNEHEIFDILFNSEHIFTDIKIINANNNIKSNTKINYGLTCKFPTLKTRN